MKQVWSHIKIAVWSTIGVLSAVVFFVFLKWLLIVAGLWISGYQIQLIWEHGILIARSPAWNVPQVLLVYLVPYSCLLILYLSISWKRLLSRFTHTWWRFFIGWTYAFLGLFVYFMPFWEMILQQDLYHAFNWLHISRSFQILFGLALWLLFLPRLFRVSQLFSVCIDIPDQMLTPQKITCLLPALWYLPFLTLLLTLFLLFGIGLLTYYRYFFSGLFLVLLLNTALIRKYQVIVR